MPAELLSHQAKPLLEIVAVAVLPVMLLAYYVIQRLVVHHTNSETVLMLEELAGSDEQVRPRH